MLMMNLIQKIHTKEIHHEISSYFFLQAMFNVISCKPSPFKLTVPLLGKHMVVSSQNPHQPYTEKLFHHLLSRESGNWKATKI